MAGIVGSHGWEDGSAISALYRASAHRLKVRCEGSGPTLGEELFGGRRPFLRLCDALSHGGDLNVAGQGPCFSGTSAERHEERDFRPGETPAPRDLFVQITSEGAFWPCEGVHGARGHAGWALGRIGTGEALRALREREGVEEDQWVREEISLAI